MTRRRAAPERLGAPCRLHAGAGNQATAPLPDLALRDVRTAARNQIDAASSLAGGQSLVSSQAAISAEDEGTR